jgi:biotin carboxyl carrier protein
VEFAPAPFLSPDLRIRITEAATLLARSVGVHTLCTFEFLLDGDGRFVFMEANPRLQVEHTVTEQVTGIDLVQAQFQLAAGVSLDALQLAQADVPPPRGLAVQLRINMEQVDAHGNALPGSGTLRAFDPPGGAGIRIDSYARTGWAPTTRFDSLLAKLIVHAPSGRMDDLLERAYRALCEFRIEGVPTNLGFLQNLLRDADVAAGRIDTRFVERHGERLAAGMDSHPRLYAEDAALPDAVEEGADDDDAPAGSVTVAAPVGGQLLRYLVAAGDPVRAGQAVAVIESMRDGAHGAGPGLRVVLSLQRDAGEIVTTGRALLALAPATPRTRWPRPAKRKPTPPRRQPGRTARAARRPAGREPPRCRGQAALARQPHGARAHRPPVRCGQLRRDGRAGRARGGHQRPADGFVIGTARIAGRPVMLLAQDFTVLGGSSGQLGKAKLLRAMARARTNGMPFVMLFDGGGHRIQDGQNSRQFSGSTPAFQEFSRLSGWVPVVSAVLGAASPPTPTTRRCRTWWPWCAAAPRWAWPARRW